MKAHSEIKAFNIRVYGIFINQEKQIILSDEIFRGNRMTKFPGGGLQYGEGTIDCLKREMREEMEQEIEIISHYYTTDFFQRALFFEDQQLISIYYRAQLLHPEMAKISKKAFDFDTDKDGFSFRWVDIESLSPEILSFPIDKKVAEMIFQHKNL